jgi:hypothetical protein
LHPLREVLCAHEVNVGSGTRPVFGGTTDPVRSWTLSSTPQ